MNDSPLEPWLALSFMPGMSPRLFKQLLIAFKSPQALLESQPLDLKVARLNPELRAAILNYQKPGRDVDIASKIEKSLLWHEEAKDQKIICSDSSDYPSLLKEIPDPPPLLYIKGDLEKVQLPQLAMVGSRNPGPTGRKNARRFARELSEVGYVVCSGLALGVDSESHLGALEGGGATIAVLGTGIDKVYPYQNRGLAQNIIENGALVSEFPLGTKPQPYNFPKRNRIISGLSQGTLIVEAALRSGSLITARMALEQGREVFAMPGSINSSTTRGCHALIKQGAKLVERVEDILEELGSFVELAKEELKIQPQQISLEASQVLAEIDYEAVNMDYLVLKVGIDVARISVLMLELELKGLIQAVPGGYILAPK